ncbi:MAG: hypothetical protein QM723_12880 [Myxococcaceae bacterium]
MRFKSLILAGLVSSVALADTMTFSPGALIIPEQSNFQDGCGAVSAYGLVWRILQSNQAGHFNAAHPVTVYWVISSTKQSPNRCTPTDLSTPPSLPLDSRWKDGCDAAISAVSAQPVTMVDFTSSWPSSGIFPDATVPMYAFSTSTPAYAAISPLNHSSKPAWTTIRYMGGPFVIDAVDAKNVFDFLKTGDSAVGVPLSALSPFTSTATACPGTVTADPSAHHVNIHQAKVQFSAEVGKRMNQTPPKLALLDSNSDNSDATSGILVQYLQNAGLYITGTGALHQDSVGCPAGTLNSGCTDNGGYPGLIYDRFDTPLDLMSTAANPYGLLNHTTGGRLDYKVFWTPHWLANTYSCGTNADAGTEAAGTTHYGCSFSGATACTGMNRSGGSSTDSNGNCNTTNSAFNNYVWDGTSKNIRENAMRNIAHFADQRGTGLMAECASLETYETSWATNYAVQSPKESDGGIMSVSPQFMFTKGIYENGIALGGWSGSFPGNNCTDPNYDGTSSCMIYPNPANIFSQAGDYYFDAQSGHVQNYKPFYTSRGSDYKAGVTVLATSWISGWQTSSWPVGQSGAYPVTGGGAPCDPKSTPNGGSYCKSGFDFFTMGYKDNSVQKATVVYISGHQYNDQVAGDRIILNTLFALGADPVSDARSASVPVPFVNEFGSDSSGSGTRLLELTSLYKSVSGYPPNVQNFNAAQGSAWVFPYVPGNMVAHSVGSTAGALQSGENDLLLSATVDGTPATWDAEMQLSNPSAANPIQTPGDRNIFTYLGGYVSDNTSLPAVRRAPSKVLQVGWTPEDVDGTKINNSYLAIPNPSCVDVVGLSSLAIHNGTDPAKGLTIGADGICDLQEAAGAPLAINPSNGPDATNRSAYKVDFPNTQQILQKVRGYCYANSTRTDGDAAATPVLRPSATTSPSQCNDPNADNKAHLGGFVYSAPAIIPYSSNVKDFGTNGLTQHRPTIAIASAYDGMVHAFYVAGGAGYEGPTGAGVYGLPSTTLHFRHQSPANGALLPGWDAVAPPVPVKFNHPWLDPNSEPSITPFIPPPPMTELWAFMPASQLPSLRNNNTKVDSSIVVQDVFADFGYTGTAEWHTVISGSTGSPVNGTYSEVFALDVTNPLKPVLLWDLVGAWDTGGAEPANSFPAFMLANDGRAAGSAPGFTSTYGVGSVFRWDGKNAEYEDDPANTSDIGRKLWSVYDYHEMGGAQGLAMLSFTPASAVPPRTQGQQLSAVFVSTNAGPNDTNNDGANVYAIEVTSGQLAWAWKIKEHDGDDDSTHHHGHTANSVPPAASLFFDDLGGNYSLLFGDQLGRVWSLDPGTGESNYVMASSADKHGHHHGCGAHGGGHGCGCPAVIADSDDNDPMPITTLVSVARIPNGAGSPFNGHAGEEVVIFGTGAEPWAYSTVGAGNHVNGRIYVSYLRNNRTCDDNARSVTGVLQTASGFPYKFPNDITVNGDIAVSGQLAWFGTTSGALSDLFAPVLNITGGFYGLDLGGGCDNTILTCNVPGQPIGQWGVFNRGTFGGGPTVLHDTNSNKDFVVGTQTTRIDAMALSNGSGPGKATSQISLSVSGAGAGKNGAKGIIEWVKRRLR